MTRPAKRPTKARTWKAWVRLDSDGALTELSLFGRLPATFINAYHQRVRYGGRIVRVEIRELPRRGKGVRP